MKILVTGANGFLGQHLVLFLAQQSNYSVTATGRNACRIPSFSQNYIAADIAKENEVELLIAQSSPDIIIHTAAMSKPDECNNDNAACWLQNVTATQYLLKYFAQVHQPTLFIYLSTDFIFGEDGPHSESEQKEPLNFYGESKLAAEEAVINSGVAYAIVRPVFIYGEIWHGLRPSFLHWVKNSLEQGKQIKVVSDQQRTPTYVSDICKGIASIIDMKKEGVFHLAGKDILSPYEMAIATANVLQLDAALIENVTSDIFVEPVKRAKRSGLKIDKAIAELNYDPLSFEEGVRKTFHLS
jgi:dTDP-4-dehydrorhamnose reductase